jgi:hypothetical protein
MRGVAVGIAVSADEICVAHHVAGHRCEAVADIRALPGWHAEDR